MHKMVIGWLICGGRHCCRAINILPAPAGNRTPGCWIYRQTLYHVAVKAGFCRKAVEAYLYIPRPFDI